MFKILYQAMKLGATALGIMWVAASSAIASEPPIAPPATTLEPINLYNGAESEDPMEQVSNVSQLTDVKPGDWAYESLRALVERYGCISGYPDSLFRGNRSLSRYEFAAGVNACLKQIEKLLVDTSNVATRQDLESLQRLAQEFQAEISSLRARVDNLETRTEFLENHQFSTTTKLNGEVVVALTGIATGQGPQSNTIPFGNSREIPRNTVLAARTRLNFDTSFTGEDLLRTRLQSANLDAYSADTTLVPEGDLRFGAGAFGTGSNQFAIDALFYSFPLGKNTSVVLQANAGASDDFASTINPFIDGDGGSGAVTNFATRNPIYYYAGGSGLAINHKFGDRAELSLGYLAPNGANPRTSNGLFNGAYGAIAQLLFKPSEKFNLGFYYLNAYNTDNGTGSLNTNLVRATNLPVSTNSYGVGASWQLSPQFVINGWAGYTAARVINTGDADIWNYAIALAFPDLGKEGNLAGIVVGMEPKLSGASSSLTTATGIARDRDTSLHIEGFYQYKVSDNVAITPALVWLTAPNHDERNSDIVIGTIRTTFTF
jgi:Carbohydrate-selective porin, OprB family/S-layer homology domain